MRILYLITILHAETWWKGYLPSMFYGGIISKAKKFKCDTTKLKLSFCKGYDLSTIDDSLRQVSFAENIDNLLVQLVGQYTN